ncbi:MAG: hypothetical protein LAT55_00600 [Opitutales bacterium]|nr:hypothetical protein [Opitutales bacterium]
MKNDSLELLLSKYVDLTDRLSALLKREQSHMNQGLSLEETVDEKRVLLEEITNLNADLQAIGRERAPLDVEAKARMETVQNRLMSVLKLDRSVEKTFLSNFARPPAPPKLDPAPKRVSQVYQRQVGRGHSS